MRLVLNWNINHYVPPGPAVDLTTAEGPPRPDAPVTVDPGTCLSNDQGIVTFTATVGPEAFDGSHNPPVALVVRVYEGPEGPEGPEVATGSAAVLGPGPVRVPLVGLQANRVYHFRQFNAYAS